MKREQEEIDVVQTNARRVHGMSALMYLGSINNTAGANSAECSPLDIL